MPVTFVRKSQVETDPILQAASRMEPKLRDAFLAAVAYLKKRVSLTELEHAIATGDANGALAAVAVDQHFVAALNGQTQTGIQSFKSAIRETFAAGAVAAKEALPAKIGIGWAFDITNPESVKFLQSYQFNLIKQITDDTKENIRQVITNAFEQGGHPYEQARLIRDSIGLTQRQQQAVENYRRALSSPDTMADALERELRDKRFDRTVMAAVRNDTALTQEQIDQQVQRYYDRYLKYRAESIARTETVRSANTGQFALHQQAKRNNVIPIGTLKQSIASGDDATCPVCLGIEAEGPIPLDQPFSTGDMYAPYHTLCRCGYGLIFPRAA